MVLANGSGSAGKISLFWSGDIGKQVAEFHRDLLAAVFGDEHLFISTEIDLGNDWMERLTTEIAEAPVGVFFLTPDALESRWMPIELGMFLATHDSTRVLPVRVAVTQALMEARLPVLRSNNAKEFGSLSSFVSLCSVCAEALFGPSQAAQVKAKATATWEEHATEANQLFAAASAVLPNNYDGTTRFSMSLKTTNFQMPQVFSAFERELFLVGINHAFVLNTEANPRVMVALLKRLLTSQGAKARFMISDVWRPGVLECYAALVPPGFAQGEAAAFNRIYKTPEAPSYIGKLIEKEFGAAGLRRFIEEELLQIRLLPTILDTLWFVDQRRCQYTLAVALGGPFRPYVHCGSGPDEAPQVLDYYRELAETAYTQATVLWPPPSA